MKLLQQLLCVLLISGCTDAFTESDAANENKAAELLQTVEACSFNVNSLKQCDGPFYSAEILYTSIASDEQTLDAIEITTLDKKVQTLKITPDTSILEGDTAYLIPLF